MPALRKTILTGLVGLTLGGAALSWRAARAARGAEATSETRRAEVAALNREARQLEGRIAAAGQRRAEREIVRKTEAVHAAAPSAAGAGVAPRRPPTPSDPERQAAQLKSFRARVPLEYLAFFRARGIGEADAARLADVLSEHEASRLDLLAVAREKGLAMGDPAVATLRRQEDERYRAELTQLLGAEGAKALETYQAAAPVRNAVGQLAGTLALTPEPLTSTQTRQLAALLQEQGYRERRTDPAMWNAVLERAGTFLTARQKTELQAQGQAAQDENAFQELTKLVERVKK